MRASRMVARTWGTWYTADGERADGWPTEKAGGAAQPPRDTRVVVGSARHALGAGDGLAGVFSGVRSGGGPLVGVL